MLPSDRGHAGVDNERVAQRSDPVQVESQEDPRQTLMKDLQHRRAVGQNLERHSPLCADYMLQRMTMYFSILQVTFRYGTIEVGDNDAIDELCSGWKSSFRLMFDLSLTTLTCRTKNDG